MESIYFKYVSNKTIGHLWIFYDVSFLYLYFQADFLSGSLCSSNKRGCTVFFMKLLWASIFSKLIFVLTSKVWSS